MSNELPDGTAKTCRAEILSYTWNDPWSIDREILLLLGYLQPVGICFLSKSQLLWSCRFSTACQGTRNISNAFENTKAAYQGHVPSQLLQIRKDIFALTFKLKQLETALVHDYAIIANMWLLDRQYGELSPMRKKSRSVVSL